jgi:alkanesulfonate monooxygenase SsuD/methylene tetrahydromethanopterin reductase-like flavin-dependent oxidoreductase (luciferase family)
MLEFGIFDHLDDDGTALGAFLERRLRLVELIEGAGFYGYHLAEHHSTPLGRAPSPSVFLAAAIQRTKRIRLGPLCVAAASSAAAL